MTILIKASIYQLITARGRPLRHAREIQGSPFASIRLNISSKRLRGPREPIVVLGPWLNRVNDGYGSTEHFSPTISPLAPSLSGGCSIH
jgi:hypothetical protein